ncbi:Hint domain-containing protein [Jannaschia aquimarina]|nr:Hint domain-containing protein [Jannaschia aquimarina]
MQLRIDAKDLIAKEDTLPADVADAQEIASVKGGIARGTTVLTARGEVRIEELEIGDRVITRERGFAILRRIDRVDAPACTIRTDSLGLARPDRDTTVAADQHIALRDWRAKALFDTEAALVPASRLTDGKQISRFGEACFYRLSFDAPLTVYANGLETPVGRTEADVIEVPPHS